MASVNPPDTMRPPSVANRQTDPLARIEARLAALDARTAWMETAAVQAPHVIATAADTLDAFARDHDVSSRVDAAAKLLDRLTDPKVLVQLEGLLELVQKAPQAVATLSDTLDALATSAEAKGIELDGLVPRLSTLGTDLVVALQESEGAPPAPKGVFALLRELKDDDVRAALGFALALAKSLGRRRRHHDAALTHTSTSNLEGQRHPS